MTALIILYATSSAQRMWQINKDTVINWYYEDGDEFNDAQLNTDKWNYQFGWARSIFGNKEQQYYTDGKNYVLKDGKLLLYAKREKITANLIDYLPETDSIKNGNKFDGYNKRTFNYSAGLIQSKRNYQYGFFEIKCKIPPQKGYWPAFWLYGGTPNEEIDWIESKTEKPTKIHVGRHSKVRSENKFRVGWDIKKKWWGNWLKFKGNLTKDYNIIAGEWNPAYVKFYLNGECIAYSKLKMPEPKNLVANIAVPSNGGAFGPGPDTCIIQSGDFAIDYIRIWTTNELNNTNATKSDEATKKFYTPHTTSIGKSALVSKTKRHYGKKEDHKNEGIFVTLTPASNTTYNLLITGKEIPANASYKILDSNEKILEQGNLNYGTKELLAVKGTTLIVQCYNKTVSYGF